VTWGLGRAVGGAVLLALPVWLAAAQPAVAPPAAAAAAQDPVTRSPHGALAGECSTCHTAEGWTPLRHPLAFDHRGMGFALEGAHSQAGCRDCHQSLVFSNVGTACADCHRDPHRGELGVRCDGCHLPQSWTNRQEFFRVHNRTRFPLLAAHARLDCEACHRGQQPQQYVGTPTECVSCHLRDYEATRDPDHTRLRLSRECSQCHSIASTSWEGGVFSGSFPHPATFPLRAAHAALSCDRCHAGGFTGTSRECVSCHRADFDGARDPDHRSGAFSTRCQDCHNDTGWEPATFDHAVAGFALTGAHGRVDCASCHAGGRFQGTPSDCVACHRDDYDRATNPNHRASAFPTGCAACHSTNDWRPATFDHGRFFPLARDHSVSCGTCHVNASNFRDFQCLSCHDHNREEMDDEHRRVNGYRYESRACYSCHPRGVE
jgi:hypothetical protein